jgi:AAA15 family ATPase/GTPase
MTFEFTKSATEPSFEDPGVINLDKRMNIIIGPNNAGKSVIIKALYLLQNASALNGSDIR